VTAAASGNSPFRSWPSPPPVSGNASADCVGVIADAAEFALWLSPHIITDIDRVLAQLFKWPQPQIDAYLRAIVKAAEHSHPAPCDAASGAMYPSATCTPKDGKRGRRMRQ
jgi:hypothetical protein